MQVGSPATRRAAPRTASCRFLSPPPSRFSEVRPPLTHPAPLAARCCASGLAAARSGDQMAVSAHHPGRGRARVRRFGFWRAGASARVCLFVFRLPPPPSSTTTTAVRVTFYANGVKNQEVHLHQSITRTKHNQERVGSGGTRTRCRAEPERVS